MVFPQIQQLYGGDSQNDPAPTHHDPNVNNFMAQNANNDIRRQMQQQLGPLTAQQANMEQINVEQLNASGGLGQLQNLNSGVLMGAFQSAPSPAPNTQQGFLDAQRDLLAAALAANTNTRNQPTHATGTQQQQQQQQQPQQQQQQQQQVQPTAFPSLQGLEQLQNLNPLQQAVAQQNSFQDIRRQSLGGLPGLQQQIVSLQQQLGGNSSQQHQNQQQQSQQQQPNQQQQVQQGQGGLPTWMGQNLNGNSLTPNALALPGGLGGDPNNLQQDSLVDQLQGQNNLQPNLIGMGNQGLQQFPQQQQLPQQVRSLVQPQQEQKRRSSSLSSGSISPVPKQKGANSIQALSNAFGTPLEDDEPTTKPRKPSTDKKKRARSFPEKLMQAMIEYADEDAVAWLPDGKSFVIVNPDMFCNEVLNKVFKESKYASFVRKLHRWGFVRLTSGTGTDCFHHPQFQRNRRELSGKITCAPRGDKDKPEGGGHSKGGIKPPSLAGVEKFIRAKVVAAAASAAANVEDNILLKDGDDLSGDDDAEPCDV